MTKTFLLADQVIRDRLATLRPRAPRRRSGDRPARRVGRHGALRLVPPLIAIATLAVGLLGGTAYAFFSTTGSGTGQASVGSLQPVVVEHATVLPGVLFPGGKAGLSLKIKNPNERTLTLVGVSEDGAVTVTPSTGACTGTTAGVSVSSAVASGLDDSLYASTTTTGVTTLVIPTGALMSTSSPNACQSKSFHIPVAVTVRS